MKLFDTLLSNQKENRTSTDIIKWWELKRVLYNFIILIPGLFSMMVMEQYVEPESGEEVNEPIAIIGFAIICNIGYTLGWMTEVFYDPGPAYGPKMFKLGLKLTLIVVLLPALLHVIFWIGKLPMQIF